MCAIKKTTAFGYKDITVEIQMSDGARVAIGKGRAFCADGDIFNEEKGEKIASIRAKLSATKILIETNQQLVNTYKKLLDDAQQYADRLEVELKESIK